MGWHGERDRRELCGVAQTLSGDNETTTAHREVADGNSGQFSLLHWLTVANLGRDRGG